MSGRRAVFLSVHGGGMPTDESHHLGVFLGYVVPVTNAGK